MHAPVFTKHENTEGAQTVESADFFDLIVVEIEEDESLERAEVRDLADAVVLVVEQSQLLLALQHRTHRQAPPAHAQQPNALHAAQCKYCKQIGQLKMRALSFYLVAIGGAKNVVGIAKRQIKCIAVTYRGSVCQG